MRIRQYGRLYQLTWMPSFFPVNCYLVEEEKDLTLIDAGMGFSAKGILEAARGIGKPIARLALTHAHGDHVGSLDALAAALPEAAVLVSERDSALLRGDRTLRPGEENTPVRGSVPKGIRTSPDVLLRADDSVGSLSVVAAPGHTPGSVAYLDRRSGALIAGDAFQTFRRVAVSGTAVPLFPFPAMATWSKREALASARRLLELSPALLAVGHGDALEQPAEAMSRAIGEAERRLDTVHKEG